MKLRMLRAQALLSFATACGGGEPEPIKIDPLAHVDPFIGSGGLGFGVGSISPGPTRVFGLAKPAPDTSTMGGAPEFSHCAGYYYEDREIRAFSQIRLSGTGVPDYGVLGFMPVREFEYPITERKYRAKLQHERESAEVGRYSVHLAEAASTVELAATRRTSIITIDAEGSAPVRTVINLAHGLGNAETIDASIRMDAGVLRGYLKHLGGMTNRFGGFTLYFAARFSEDPQAVTFLRNGAPLAGASTSTGAAAGALLDFGAGPKKVGTQIGLSFVDEVGALANLDAETTDFDTAVAATQAEFRALMSRVQVEGGTDDNFEKFYSALYHVFQMPTLLSDVDDRYRGVDGRISTANGFEYYSDFSTWDTYRTLHPLLTWIAPEIQRDFDKSLIAMLGAMGEMPEWPLATGETHTMIGNHGETVLVDSALRGGDGFDHEAFFDQALALTATIGANASRECAARWLGPGPCVIEDGNGTVSHTLENAYNDFSLAELAERLGRTSEAKMLRERAGKWAQTINPSGYAQGRSADGSFPEGFKPDLFHADFVEGNSRQWTPSVALDVPGMVSAIGKERLIQQLIELFEQSAAAEDSPFPDLWYWHGNEPDLHAAYLFLDLGRPELSDRWVRWIQDEKYGTGPDGLDGNDDGGTLSAWLVAAQLGLYPVAGTDRWWVGAPRFSRAVVTTDRGTLELTTEGSVEGVVRRVELDGSVLDTRSLEHAMILDGHLHFVFE